MVETKAGGQTKKEDTLKGLSEKARLRKKKVQASNEHAYTLEEVAEMPDQLPEPASHRLRSGRLHRADEK